MLKPFTASALAVLATLAALAPGQADGENPTGSSARAASSAAESMRVYEQGLKHRQLALAHEARAAEAEPGKARETHRNRARRALEEAIALQREAVRLDGRNYRAFNELGYALRKTGDFRSAAGAHHAALAINPEYHDAWAQLGEACLALGILKEAKRSYMALYRADRELAARLMAAIERWLAARPGGLTAEEAELREWAQGRKRLAEISAELPRGDARVR